MHVSYLSRVCAILNTKVIQCLRKSEQDSATQKMFKHRREILNNVCLWFTILHNYSRVMATLSIQGKGSICPVSSRIHFGPGVYLAIVNTDFRSFFFSLLLRLLLLTHEADFLWALIF